MGGMHIARRKKKERNPEETKHLAFNAKCKKKQKKN